MTTTSAPVQHLPRTGNYRWVPLWGLPLRVMHWVAAVCIVVLAVTGLYIGKPYFMTGGEASSHFLMGWVRFLHSARRYQHTGWDVFQVPPPIAPSRNRDWQSDRP